MEFLMSGAANIPNQLDNIVFHELWDNRIIVAAVVVVLWAVFKWANTRQLLAINFKTTFIILLLAAGALYYHQSAVQSKSSQYIVTDPVQIDSIVEECTAKSRQTSSKIYFFLWSSKVGHLSALLFNKERTYLSHYPYTAVNFADPLSIKRPVPSANELVGEIVRDRPDKVIILPEGILSAENIDAMANVNMPYYKGKYKNCADQINLALKAGKFFLRNSSFRFLLSGLSVPDITAERIAYTIYLRDHPFWQLIHLILTITVYVTSILLFAQTLYRFSKFEKLRMFALEVLCLLIFLNLRIKKI